MRCTSTWRRPTSTPRDCRSPRTEGAAATTRSDRPLRCAPGGVIDTLFGVAARTRYAVNPVRLVKFDLSSFEVCRRRSAPAQFEDTSHDKDNHGFCHQEAPQADGEEEAPQAAAQDASPASQQEVTGAPSGPKASSPHAVGRPSSSRYAGSAADR